MAKRKEDVAKSGDIKPHEAQAALEAAGYPLEMRLYHHLSRAGFTTRFGERARLDATTTKEIDVVAQLSFSASYPENGHDRRGQLIVQVFVQAKKLHDACFTGMPGESRGHADARMGRVPRVGGLPSARVVLGQDLKRLLFPPGNLLEPLDRLNDAPWCIQWSVTKRRPKDNERPYLTHHDEQVYEDLATLVRATAVRLQSISVRQLEKGLNGDPMPVLVLAMPVLVVETPLYTYDVATGAIEIVDRLTLDLNVDHGAWVLNQAVEVVTPAGFDRMTQRWKELHLAMSERFGNRDRRA